MNISIQLSQLDMYLVVPCPGCQSPSGLVLYIFSRGNLHLSLSLGGGITQDIYIYMYIYIYTYTCIYIYIDIYIYII